MANGKTNGSSLNNSKHSLNSLCSISQSYRASWYSQSFITNWCTKYWLWWNVKIYIKI